MKNKTNKILMILLIVSFCTATVTAATPEQQIMDTIKGLLKPMAIVPYVDQPYVVQANGVTYDAYLTNTGFTDCVYPKAYVVELYPHGASYSMTHAIAHTCVAGIDRYNSPGILTSVGQELANNYQQPAPAYTTQPGYTAPPAPGYTAPQTSSDQPTSPRVQIIPPVISNFFTWLFSFLR